MYRLLLALLAVLATGCSASGPDLQRSRDLPAADSTEAPAADLFDELDARLDLTEDQERSVRRTLNARKEALGEARRQPDIRARRQATERAFTEADSRIIAALTPTQREIYEEIRAEREVAYDPAVARQLRLLDERLNLSEDQKTQIAEILTRQVEQVEPLIARGRADGEGRDEIIEEINAIRERTDEEITALLTEDQIREYRILRGQQSGRRPGRRR